MSLSEYLFTLTQSILHIINNIEIRFFNIMGTSFFIPYEDRDLIETYLSKIDFKNAEIINLLYEDSFQVFYEKNLVLLVFLCMYIQIIDRLIKF